MPMTTARRRQAADTTDYASPAKDTATYQLGKKRQATATPVSASFDQAEVAQEEEEEKAAADVAGDDEHADKGEDSTMFPRFSEARERMRKAVSNELELIKDDLHVVGEAVVGEFKHMKHEMEEVRQWVIKSAEEAPVFMRFNEFIKHGYRINAQTVWDCLQTIFAFHNETVNIWSHMLGLFIMIALGVYTVATTDFKHPSDFNMFVLFFACSALMFLTSSLYHIFMCHSEHVCDNMLTCDYMGIFTMILGSTVSAYEVVFYCIDEFRLFYQIGTSICCVSGMIMMAVPFFNHPDNNALRILIMVSSVAFSVIPVGHVALVAGIQEIVPWLGVLALYAAGLMFYLLRFPECIAPGKFDYVLSSHNLWHFFILLAALQTFYGVYSGYHYKLENGCTSYSSS